MRMTLHFEMMDIFYKSDVAQLCTFTKHQAETLKKKSTCQEIQEPCTYIFWPLFHTIVSSLPQMLPFLTAPDLALVTSAAWLPALKLGACFFLSVGHTCIKEHKPCDAIL